MYVMYINITYSVTQWKWKWKWKWNGGLTFKREIALNGSGKKDLQFSRASSQPPTPPHPTPTPIRPHWAATQTRPLPHWAESPYLPNANQVSLGRGSTTKGGGRNKTVLQGGGKRLHCRWWNPEGYVAI